MALKDDYFTISQAANQLGITRQTISRWIQKKKISSEKVGREILINKEELYKYNYGRLTDDYAESMVNMFKMIVELYLKKKGYLGENKHIKDIDVDGKKMISKLSADEREEIVNIFKPFIEPLVKVTQLNVTKIPMIKKQENNKT